MRWFDQKKTRWNVHFGSSYNSNQKGYWFVVHSVLLVFWTEKPRYFLEAINLGVLCWMKHGTCCQQKNERELDNGSFRSCTTSTGSCGQDFFCDSNYWHRKIYERHKKIWAETFRWIEPVTNKNLSCAELTDWNFEANFNYRLSVLCSAPMLRLRLFCPQKWQMLGQ